MAAGSNESPCQDMTLQQLRMYDGQSATSDGRICVAVNGKIFDVTKGKRFYGQGQLLRNN